VDETLSEFLALMQPRSKARVWSNDDMLPGGVLPAAVAGKEKKGQRVDIAAAATAKAAAAARRAKALAAGDEAAEGGDGVAFEGEDAGSSDEYEAEVFDAAAGGKGAARTGGALRKKGAAAVDSESESEEEEEGEGEGRKDRLVVDAGVSDLDYLRGRMKPKLDDEDEEGDEEEEQEEEEEEEEEEEGEQQAAAGSDEQRDGDQRMLDAGSQGEEAAADGALDASARGDQRGVGPSAAAAAGGGGAAALDDAQQQIMETGRLFVRNLSYETGEADLSEAFGAFGALEEVHLVLDRWGRGLGAGAGAG